MADVAPASDYQAAVCDSPFLAESEQPIVIQDDDAL